MRIRIDSRWWWEPDVLLDADMLDALGVAIENFVYYLHADGIGIGEGVDLAVRETIAEVSI